MEKYQQRSMEITDKIQPDHLECKAILYILQSSAHQVMHTRENGALQYAMRDWLIALEWSHIGIFDENLGCPATVDTAWAGFERQVTKVCLCEVSAVAA
jgi:hypothetical protein